MIYETYIVKKEKKHCHFLLCLLLLELTHIQSSSVCFLQLAHIHIIRKTFNLAHPASIDNAKLYIYLLTCNVCLKQYVGQAVEEFRYRWNNYKNNGCKYQEDGTCMQQHLFEHLSEEGHHSFLEDVSITFIDKTVPSNPLQ